jgi:hypothetical protein
MLATSARAEGSLWAVSESPTIRTETGPARFELEDIGVDEVT